MLKKCISINKYFEKLYSFTSNICQPRHMVLCNFPANGQSNMVVFKPNTSCISSIMSTKILSLIDAAVSEELRTNSPTSYCFRGRTNVVQFLCQPYTSYFILKPSGFKGESSLESFAQMTLPFPKSWGTNRHISYCFREGRY